MLLFYPPTGPPKDESIFFYEGYRCPQMSLLYCPLLETSSNKQSFLAVFTGFLCCLIPTPSQLTPCCILHVLFFHLQSHATTSHDILIYLIISIYGYILVQLTDNWHIKKIIDHFAIIRGCHHCNKTQKDCFFF